jgi:hypothetical protein
MEGNSSDNFLLICFAIGLLLLAAVFGSGAMKGVPSAANLLQSGPPAGSSVVGSPTVSAQFIDQVLCKYSSPACGTGGSLYSYGQYYGIDPVFPLAIFWNESNFGRAGMAASTRSLGNLRCIPSAACWNGYAAFASWSDGYRAFYTLISGPLYVGSGLSTPESIIPRYAPSGDHNSPSHYIGVVESAMSIWRAGKVTVP